MIYLDVVETCLRGKQSTTHATHSTKFTHGQYWRRGEARPEIGDVSYDLYFNVRSLLQRGKYEEATPILVANPCLMAVAKAQSLFMYFARRCDAGAFLCMLKAWPAKDYSIGFFIRSSRTHSLVFTSRT
mgnify:CR=1 FL=1